MEDIANIPEMFFMRVLDNARLGGTHEDLRQVVQPTAIPTLAIAKLVKWWRRAQILCPPDVPRPPPQKFDPTEAAKAP